MFHTLEAQKKAGPRPDLLCFRLPGQLSSANGLDGRVLLCPPGLLLAVANLLVIYTLGR